MSTTTATLTTPTAAMSPANTRTRTASTKPTFNTAITTTATKKSRVKKVHHLIKSSFGKNIDNASVKQLYAILLSLTSLYASSGCADCVIS
jgi:hypothetical protein